MRSLPRLVTLLAAATLLAALVVLDWPDPPPARANVGCEVATAPAGAIAEGVGAITGGAIGGGNPVGDACNSVTDGAVEAVTSPVTGALKGIGNSIFSQVTTWVTEGTAWLIEKVVTETQKTTTPELQSKGFLSEYGRMAQIAALLAAATALLAILEAIAQSSWALLARAFLVNLPLAFIATSVAFVVVQLLLVATDALFSSVPMACGPYAVRVRLVPADSNGTATSGANKDWGGDFSGRLRQQGLHWDMQLQPFISETLTPIEDASINWTSPYTTVARFTLPQQDTASAHRRERCEKAEASVFDPWQALAEHRPLVDVQRARKVVYFVSQKGRGAS